MSGDGQCEFLLPAYRLCSLVNNETMNGENNKEAINLGKNRNNYSKSTVKRTAERFRDGVTSGTSSKMLLCPSSPDWGTPKEWLEAYSKASSHAKGEKQVRERRCHRE